MKKIFEWLFICATGLSVFDKSLNAATQHGMAMHGDLKYKSGQPFDYVDINALKGGNIRLAVIGTFDSMNPFIIKGTPPAGLSIFSETLVFETLMKRSADEPFSLYGLIAEKVELAPDRSWIIFHINPNAKWSDGRSITAEDVQFSHQTLRDYGLPNMRLFYTKVAHVDLIDTHTIKFTFKSVDDKLTATYDAEAPLLIALMPILPKHFLQDKDFEKICLEPMVGSGPYHITTVEPGKKIVYSRRSDYWGRDLPVNAGQFNFDTFTYDYYRDQHVAFEAFKAHAYDIRIEDDIALWHTGYDFPAVKQGQVKILELDKQQPAGMHAFVFNTRRPFFGDQRVRHALNYAFDFNWLNKNLFYNARKRHRSYYQNSELEHRDQLSLPELDILKTVAPEIWMTISTNTYLEPINYKDPQELRRGLAYAKKLLAESGWHVDKNGRLRNQYNDLFKFELLLYNADDEKIALSLARNLKTLGIECVIRVVDTAQFESRRINFDFDMIMHTWGQSHSPGNEQTYYWSSNAADQEGSRNYCGIKSTSIDKLCAMLAGAKDRTTLVSTGRVLDRLLINGHYVIPLYYKNKAYLAYWDQFAFPAYNSKVGVRIATWWSKAVQ